MDLKQYVQDAIRTESQIDEVVTDKKIFNSLLKAFINIGTLLDMIKKNVFYGKVIDSNKFATTLLAAHDGIMDVPVWTMLSLPDGTAVNQHPGWNPSTLNIHPRVFHAIIGALTESAELAEALQKGLMKGDENTTKGEVDFVNILEEFGDINWYQAIAIDHLDGDFEELLTRNIAKLKARFPHKFTTENAINRDLKTERAILEGKVN